MIAVAALTLVIGGLAAAVLVNRSVQASAREEFTRQAEATARLVETELTGSGRVPGRRPVEIPTLLGTVRAVGGHDYVEAALVGPRGAVTVLGDDPVLLDQVPGGVADLQRRVLFEGEVDGRPVQALALAVPVGDRGTVVVAIGTDLEIVPWREVAVRFLWALALAAIPAALLAGSLSRFAGRRLEGLRDAAGRLAGGDRAARAPEEGDDEITEVAAAFNEMAEGIEAARRREREFLASVGHDLRTPLTTISGYAEALDEGRIGPGEIGKVAGVLHRETGRLSRLVEDLMLLTRLEAREFSMRPEPVALGAHLGGIVEAYRERAERAGVRLEADLAELPPVEVDPDRIAQVLGNLIENALRYTPEGGRVVVSLAASDGNPVIRVADDGPGIEAGDLPHVFERLYVTARYRPLRPEGSGLGLPIVKELVDAMGGRLEVDSAPGRGTAVFVHLPAGGR
jgi:two-component system sensor histidine kinase BaeS